MHALPQGFPFTYLTKEMNMLESAIMENVFGKKSTFKQCFQETIFGSNKQQPTKRHQHVQDPGMQIKINTSYTNSKPDTVTARSLKYLN